MLPAERYNLVPPAEVSSCLFCGQRAEGYDVTREAGPSVQFVSFGSTGGGDDEIPGGLIETMADGPARRTHQARDGLGGGAATVVIEKPMACSLCIRRAAELIGFGDLLPLQAQLEGLEAETATLRERLEALTRAEEAENRLAQHFAT